MYIDTSKEWEYEYQRSIDFLFGRNGVVEDHVKAYELAIKAAEQGHVDAQYLIAVMYDEGTSGVVVDHAKAYEWAIKAAEQGHVNAEIMVQDIFESEESQQVFNDTYEESTSSIQVASSTAMKIGSSFVKYAYKRVQEKII